MARRKTHECSICKRKFGSDSAVWDHSTTVHGVDRLHNGKWIRRRLARLNEIEAAYLAAEAAEDMGMPTAVQDLQKLKVILTVKQGVEEDGKL